MNNSINSRVRKVREVFCNDSNKDFANQLGENTNTTSNWIREGYNVGRGVASKIASSFNVDINWLLTGEGEMFKNQEPGQSKADVITSGKLIPFYDADVAAGTEYGMTMNAISHPAGMIEIGALLKDSESALRVYGNSMTPNYPAGCVVGLRPHLDSFIEPGLVYVIETEDNRYLKRLYYNKSKSAFRCVSDNHMTHDAGPMSGELFYPDFEIPFDSVKRLLRVIGVIKRNVL